MTGFQGTFRDNKRPVITTAPDCLVYLNGELSLPSGGNPGRRINIQPLVTSINVQAGIEQSPGGCQISMHVPTHYLDDFFRGGRPILTTMMEVKVYMKGYFLVGGAPRYYPVFWGVTTSVSQSWSGGTQTVDLSCQDMLYWWTIQRINDGASLLGLPKAKQGDMNRMGSGAFTAMNPFNIIYSLARYVYGDAMNASLFLPGRHARTEPSGAEDMALMKYWSQRWGRIAHSLRMYGPKGDVLQGDLLAGVLSDYNRAAAGLSLASKAQSQRAMPYQPYKWGDIDLTKISPFSIDPGSIYSFSVWTSDFKTKKEIADMTRRVINYEFFQDFNGEIVFKPPFYNLDVMPNKPVSWIRPIDVINDSFTENPPDITFIEGTASGVANWKINFSDEVKTRATYVDYRLVQKYGWKPGSFNSEFIGAGLTNASPRILFFHLVDEMDRQNVRVNNGSITIPLRPEMKIGYPVYVEHHDAYFYVDTIAHQFSYSGQCTSNLTISARRNKFYGAFPYWKTQGGQTSAYSDRGDNSRQPPAGQIADPGVYPTNLYNRPLDPLTGNPVGDKCVIMTSMSRALAGKALNEASNTAKEQDIPNPLAEVARNLVSFRTQFDVSTGDNDYVYQIDPNRDSADPTKKIIHIRVKTEKVGEDFEHSVQFPVSDERGYEVIGSYDYGRAVRLRQGDLEFLDQGDPTARALLGITPTTIGDLPGDLGGGESANPEYALPQNDSVDPIRDTTFQTDPNNYGRRLLEIQPTGPETYNNIYSARNIPIARGGAKWDPSVSIKGGRGEAKGNIHTGVTTRNYTSTTQVARWGADGALDEARQRAGVTAEQYPDDVLLAIIQVESGGNPAARRQNKKTGKYAEYCGLVQIGHKNAADVNHAKNTDFLGAGVNDREVGVKSLEHFIRYQEKYKGRHNYNPDKMAIAWKAGPGSLSRYNEREARGDSPEALAEYLNSKWNTDVYVARFQNSRGVWGNVTIEGGSASPESQNDSEGAEFQVDAAAFDDEKDINDAGIPPGADPYYDADLSNKFYGEALEANATAGVLPANFNPIRDPREKDGGLMPYINDFLKKIYTQAFAEEAEKERELRGETRQVPILDRAPLSPPPPRRNPQAVDSPLTREEVQRALDEGKSPAEVLSKGSGGMWDEVNKRAQEFKDQFEEFKEDVSDIGRRNYNPYRENE